MGLWYWLFPRRATDGAAVKGAGVPAGVMLQQDVTANLTTGTVDVRWSRAGVDVFGVRMSQVEAKNFGGMIVDAADVLGDEVDVPVELDDE
jgi:hypothetical protein